MFVLDANVVSELRKAGLGRADPYVKAWAEATPTSALFLSAITILELETGVLLLGRRDPAQAEILRRWLDHQVFPAFADRVLPVDVAVARRCAKLHVPDRRSDRDALIAATALVHGTTVVTRNTADFEATGVSLLDPWRREPDPNRNASNG